MDYEAKIGLSRIDIRGIAGWIRKKLHINTLLFPVLKVLDMLELLFADIFYHVVEEDATFQNNCMAFLSIDVDGHYCVHIRQSVYEGALCKRGDCLGYICHEIAHFILIGILRIGPKLDYSNGIYPRMITDNTPRWKRTEWQAKALCGELMIPYDQCKNMELNTIIKETNSSYEQALFFINNVVKRKSYHECADNQDRTSFE